MRKLLFFIPLILLIFISCDGRDRIHKTSTEILQENKLLDSFSERIKYIPESYTEVETDTLLSNGFRVKIKTYTEMHDTVINAFTIDSINYKTYYRNYTGKLNVFHKNKLILDETIDKTFLNNNTDKEFWEDSIMAGLSLVEETSNSNEVEIAILYCIPESEICKDFILSVDKNGKSNLKELDPEPIH